VDGEDEVRLIGLDTPETKDPDEGVEPYGKEASNFTESVLKGEKVELEFDSGKKDQHGRLLAYVYPMGEEMFNEDLLKQGYAQVYTVSPNDKYEDKFGAAQDEARKGDLGIWGLPKDEQCQLANHGNGIGEGSPGCQKKEAAPAPSEDLYDCSDFSTQAEAQGFLLPGDPYNLDPDGDGVACEGAGGGTASPSASPSPSPNPSPNRDYNAPNPNAPGNAPSTASPGAGGGSCPQGGHWVGPYGPGDGDGDGCAGE